MSADNRLSAAKNAADNRLSAEKNAADNQLYTCPINQAYIQVFQFIPLSNYLFLNFFISEIYTYCTFYLIFEMINLYAAAGLKIISIE